MDTFCELILAARVQALQKFKVDSFHSKTTDLRVIRKRIMP